MLSFSHASRRNTKAYIVTIGDVEAFISYDTVVAVRSPKGCGRLDNVWGPTTGRHINEMGLRDWPIVDEAELHRLAEPPDSSVLEALRELCKWATGQNRAGNPYLHPPVEQALKAVMAAEGRDGDWRDALEPQS